MQHLRISGGTCDDAISPVVGVMLMLVVTIIIAAVVSGFAGGLIGDDSSQKAPTLDMDVKVINMGSWTGSGFYATVTAVSKPIPTDDLKIVTSWTATDATNGSRISGGSSVIPKSAGIYQTNTHYLYSGGPTSGVGYNGQSGEIQFSIDPSSTPGDTYSIQGWIAP